MEDSTAFYANVLGFVQVDCPEALDFEDAWLFNYGVGDPTWCIATTRRSCTRTRNELNPMNNHILFQCEALEDKLKERGVKYPRRTTRAIRTGS